MESIDDLWILIHAMQSELREQMTAAKRLEVAFTECNVQLIRRDQVARLGILKSRIVEEANNLTRIELASQKGATEGALWGDLATFALGSLGAAALGRQEAHKIGAEMAIAVLNKKLPFGTVLITIDKQGIPECVKAVSISLLARELSRSDSEVETGFKHDGYLLMTPEGFANALEKVGNEILNGSLSLPIGIDEFTKLIPVGF